MKRSMRTSTSATPSSSRRSGTSLQIGAHLAARADAKTLPRISEPADQSHAYYVIEHGGYDPYLFDNPSYPVIHRRETKPVVPPRFNPTVDKRCRRWRYGRNRRSGGTAL